MILKSLGVDKIGWKYGRFILEDGKWSRFIRRKVCLRWFIEMIVF
jgi:hypothetical protein